MTRSPMVLIEIPSISQEAARLEEARHRIRKLERMIQTMSRTWDDLVACGPDDNDRRARIQNYMESLRRDAMMEFGA